MKEFITCLVVCLVVLIVVLLIYETNKLKIVKYSIINGKMKKVDSIDKGIKIVYFSDLHIGLYLKKDKLKKIVSGLVKLDADIYIFGGDLIGYKTKKYYDYNDVKECFLPLKNKCLLAVYGNHEYKKEKGISLKEKHEFINSMGFSILCNESYTYHKDNQKITIYGMNDSVHNITLPPSRQYDLTISHEGDVIDDCNFQIMLSGHSHGGQIRIPLIPIYYRPKKGKKYTHGLYEVNDNQLLVSNGLGYGKLKIRLFAPKEIVIINFFKN